MGRADLGWQLRDVLRPLLKEKGQERVYFDIEAPLVPVLVAMETEGIQLDAAALKEFARELEKEIDAEEEADLPAGRPNSTSTPAANWARSCSETLSSFAKSRRRRERQVRDR